MSVKIILSGCSGKMGHVLQTLINEKENMNIVAGVDSKDSSTAKFPIYNNFNKITEKADVIIDFSNRSVLKGLLEYASKNKVAAVLCTTGYLQEDFEMIKESSKSIPVFRSANMSYGVNVLSKILKTAVKFLEEDFDIEIIESHHNLKQDSPSGTAKMLLKTIKDNINIETEEIYGRVGGNTKRKNNEIGIHAIRGGTIPGEHTILFAGKDENIQIKHTAMSKNIFANGAIRAAQYLISCNPGYYNMDNLLEQE